MDILRGLSNHFVDEASQPGRLESLCSQTDNSSSKPVIPESRFEEISKALEIEVKKKEWASRPRIYYILWQIKRLDAMNAFIAQGLNDTSFPYSGRNAPPETITYFEAIEFLQWQQSVYSDILHLEQGTTHCQLTDGDVLFERKPVKLGVGSQGTTIVDKVVSKRTGKLYARKRISRKKMFGFDEKAMNIYENELKTLKKVVDHHHLIKVRGTYTDKKYLVMLLEPVADENLKEYMNRGGPTTAEEQTRFRTYFGCLAHTVRFLHAPNIEILHKDVKPENILIKDGNLILTDFGTAFDWSKTGQSMTRSNAGDVRTPRYQSPEVVNGEFHRSSDIWSLGVVFLEMVTVLRGKSLRQMDEYLAAHGNHVIPIHQNLEAAMKWFELLQEQRGGSPIDNEPLIWIKAMLNRIQSNRPTADELYDNIIPFGGQFCARCCMDNDFDSDSDSYSDDDGDDDVHSASNIPSDEPNTGGQPSTPPQPESLLSEAFELGADSRNLPGSFPASERGDGEEHVLGALPPSNALVKYETNLQQASRIEGLPELGVEKVRRLKKSSRGGPRASLVRQDVSRGHGHVQTTIPAKSQISTLKTSGIWPKSDPFPDRGFFRNWLAALPAKFATSSSHVRPRTPKGSGSRNIRAPSIGNQRMQHFLSSLPEKPADFEDISNEFSGFQQLASAVGSSTADFAMPIFSNVFLERSKSLENFPTSSPLLQEEPEGGQFSDIPKSKLVHYGSENNLNLESELSKEDLQEATKELKDFKTVIAGLVKKTPLEVISALPLNVTESTVAQPITVKLVPQLSVEPRLVTSWVGQLLQNSLRESRGQPVLGEPSPNPAAWANESSSSYSTTLETRALTTGPSSPSSKTTPPPQPGSLGSFIAKVPATQRRNWESASVIMKRIMDRKTSVAPTSEMSANTRTVVSKGRVVMRWNDSMYNYLPYFVARANVGGVRELLMAGCNPGTREKPRWSPVYNAVRGKTEKHTKCLGALVAYGADMKATRFSNGRTFLHYAIENEPWSGYSTVIYVLLASGTDPNVRDKAGDLPLLMLLVGVGPLPPQKRDALYLLLAPNFNTSLDVSIAGTLDNPLHLAIRRKDAYTVDALLTKMGNVSNYMGSGLQLMHTQNGSGFTPLLLAFKVFAFAETADDELQIIKLLLEKGANPNDQDATLGETPLHLVVNGSKNTIALELLCRRSANPRKRDKAGKRPIDLVRKGQTDHPDDQWYLFAKRRLDNVLAADDYRPPELVALLAEEA